MSLAQLFVVGGLAAVLSTFADAADNAYLPTVVERERLVRRTARSPRSAAEFSAFGISGFLVHALSAPIAILVAQLSWPRRAATSRSAAEAAIGRHDRVSAA